MGEREGAREENFHSQIVYHVVFENKYLAKLFMSFEEVIDLAEMNS